VSRLFLDHGTRVEVSRTTFLVSKCLEIGAEVPQSVLMPKCPVTPIGEIVFLRWCESVQRLERQQTQLELDALRNRKPVKTVQQHVLNVVVLLGAGR